MIKIPFSEEEIEGLRYWRFHHPDPRVQVRMEALYLRSQGVANRAIHEGGDDPGQGGGRSPRGA